MCIRRGFAEVMAKPKICQCLPLRHNSTGGIPNVKLFRRSGPRYQRRTR